MADPGGGGGGVAGVPAPPPIIVDPSPILPPPPATLPFDEISTTDVTPFCSLGDRGIGALNLYDASSTIFINLAVFFVLLCLFEKVRHLKTVYYPRQDRLPHRRAPDLPKGFLAWVRPIMSIPRERILQLAGLDAYMLLRYIRMCLKVCLLSGFFGIVVLVPLYLHGNREKPYNGDIQTIMRDPKLISMGNIKEIHWLWVPIFFAYLTTFHTLFLLKREYKHFLTLRLTFLSVGDPDVDIQKSFSVMVDRIPAEYRSNAALYGLFDEIFPGDVHSAVVALRVDALEDLVAQRASTVDCLERALATRSVTNKEPMLFLPQARGNKWWNWVWRKGEKVEAIPHYQQSLDVLNEKITHVQCMIRTASDEYNQKEEERQASRRQILQQHTAMQGTTNAAASAGLLHGVSTRRMSVSPMLVGNAESRTQVMMNGVNGNGGLVEEVLALEGATHLLDLDGNRVMVDAEAGDPSRGKEGNGGGGLGSSFSSFTRSFSFPASQQAREQQQQHGRMHSGSQNTHTHSQSLHYHHPSSSSMSSRFPAVSSTDTSTSNSNSTSSSGSQRHGGGGSVDVRVIIPLDRLAMQDYDKQILAEEEGGGSVGKSGGRGVGGSGRRARGGGESVIREEDEEDVNGNTSTPTLAETNGNGNGNGNAGAITTQDFDDYTYSTKDIPKQSLCAWLKTLTKNALRFSHKQGQEAINATQEVGRALSLLALDTTMSSTGFVTFKSMTSAAVASQSLMTMEPFMFTISPAPEPRDVVWANVAAPRRLVEWREASTTLLLLFLSLFWGALVSALYRFQSDLQTWGNNDAALQHLGSWGNFFLYLGIDYVPTVLLLIILAILPNLFWWVSTRYERLRTYSDIDASVMSRYFYYQMVNIYATIVGGALLDEVVAIARDPRVVVRVLGCQVPVVAVYFMQMIVTKCFSALMWEFTRSWPLIRITFLHYFTDYDRKTARQRRAPLYVPYMAYGWVYPSLLLVLTICLTYDVIMPVTLLIGALYFFFVEILYTFHLLYVYVPQFEGGGRMWYKVFNRTLVALLLSHLTLIGYMAVLGAGNLTPVLVPLPCLLLPFYRHCANGYQEASEKLSLLAARRIDDCLREEEVVDMPAPPLGGDAAGGVGSPTPSAAASSPSPPPVLPTSPRSPRASAAAAAVEEGKAIGGGGGGGEITTSTSATTTTNRVGSPLPLMRRRRSTTAISPGTPTTLEGLQHRVGHTQGQDPLSHTHLQQSYRIMSPPHAEPPLVVDYFQISAYAQPSLREGPQEAETLPWHRQLNDPEQPPHLHPPNGSNSHDGRHSSNGSGGPSSTTSSSVSPRPSSLGHSTPAALAKRLKISEALEDMRVPLNPLPPDLLQNSASSAMSGGGNLSTISSGSGGGGGGGGNGGGGGSSTGPSPRGPSPRAATGPRNSAYGGVVVGGGARPSASSGDK